MNNPLTIARAYLDRLPVAISGAAGHAATFRAACWLVRFGLSDTEALPLLLDYNRRCDPPWAEKELMHKLKDARRVAGHEVRNIATRPAVRVAWKIEHKIPKAPLPIQLPTASRSSSLTPDCAPWLHVARQVLAGEFDEADRSTVESLTIGLRRIRHQLCQGALEHLGGGSNTKLSDP